MSTLPYSEKYEDLKGEMPLARIVEALDDDGDGLADADVWQALRVDVAARVAAAAGAPEIVDVLPPAAVAHAVRVFSLESLYIRRGYDGDRNPFAGRATAAEKSLTRHADKARADADEVKDAEAEAVAEFIGKPARIIPYGGLLP